MIPEERKTRARAFLGKTVRIRIDRPAGAQRPRCPEPVRPVRCGFLPDVTGGDGAPQNVYVLGVPEPVCECTARVIGIVYRADDAADRLVAAPEGMCFHQAEIAEAVRFQERYFRSSVEAMFHRSCGAVVFRQSGGKTEFLCLRERPAGGWSVPKGHMEAFETEEETARREIREETGLAARFVPGFREEITYEAKNDIHIYKTVVLFLAAADGALRLAPGEIAAARWLSPVQARHILPAGYGRVLGAAQKRLRRGDVAGDADRNDP